MRAPPEGAEAQGEGRARRRGAATVLMMLWTALVFPGWLVGPFLLAGRAWWPTGWAALGAQAAGFALHRVYVARRNPELLRRRGRVGEGTRRWDVAWNFLFWPLMATVACVAGLDARAGWTPMPAWLWPVGLAVLASGLGLSARAMAVNPFFEGTVRIQTELGHHVVDTGPYRTLRHPGYAGLALWALAGPFLYRSWLTFAPAMAVVAWVALRTALEDATLRRELSGYSAYAARVRSRLLPGLW